VFKAFKAHVELQFGAKIACLHDDKGGEYIGHLWDAFFAEHGIRREHTVEGMSQQGGVAERRNCTLEEHVIAMLNGARLPTRFWGEALYTYGRLLNMTPSSAIPPNTTPYERGHTFVARSERAWSRTQSLACSWASRTTSRAGSCGIRLCKAAAAASSSHAT
jgi:transposase InsO family protein